MRSSPPQAASVTPNYYDVSPVITTKSTSTAPTDIVKRSPQIVFTSSNTNIPKLLTSGDRPSAIATKSPTSKPVAKSSAVRRRTLSVKARVAKIQEVNKKLLASIAKLSKGKVANAANLNKLKALVKSEAKILQALVTASVGAYVGQKELKKNVKKTKVRLLFLALHDCGCCR